MVMKSATSSSLSGAARLRVDNDEVEEVEEAEEEDWEAEEEDWCRCSEGKDSNACTASVLTFMIEDG
jgi:hypothetical protein